MFDYLSFKKFQYGYHGKNGKVSDQTECTYWEYYSNVNFYTMGLTSSPKVTLGW